MAGNGKIGVALAGGYLLGRTKKAKIAIGLGMFLAGKKLSFDPVQLGKLLANSPALGSLNTQVRKELVEATKSAATSALTKRAGSLADQLHERSLSLSDPDSRGARDEDGDDEAEYDEEPDDDTRDQDRGTGAAPERRRKPVARSGGGKAQSTARRSASSSGRKATSAARKTASGTRKTETRRTKSSGGSSA